MSNTSGQEEVFADLSFLCVCILCFCDRRNRKISNQVEICHLNKSYKNHLACSSWDCVPVSQLIYSQLIYYKIQILSEWNQHIFRIVWMLNLNKWFMADWNNSQSDPSSLNGSAGVSVGSEERRGGASAWCQRRHFTGSDWLLMNLFWPGFGFGPALTYLDSFDWTGLALIHPSWPWWSCLAPFGPDGPGSYLGGSSRS